MLQFCSHELRHAALFKKVGPEMQTACTYYSYSPSTQLLELQAEYHKESLRLLDTVLPNLTEMLGTCLLQGRGAVIFTSFSLQTRVLSGQCLVVH